MNLRAVCSFTVPSLSILIVSLYALSHVIGYSLCDDIVDQCDRNINDLQNVTMLPDFQSERPSFLQLLPAPYVFPPNKTEDPEVENCVASAADDEPKRKLFNGKGYTYLLTPSLKALIVLDWQIYQTANEMFRAYMDKADDTSQQFENLRSYIQSFNETTYKPLEVQATVNSELMETLAWNPLAIYRTFWRFENFIKPWVTGEIQGSPFHHFQDYLKKVYAVSEGPSETDLVEAVKGILRIQHIYNLKSKDLAKGLMGGTDAGIILTAEECIQIGHHAVNSAYYYQAVEWMETAVHKITYEADSSAALENARKGLESAVNKHDLELGRVDGEDERFYVGLVAAEGDPSTRRQTWIEQSYKAVRLQTERMYARTNYWGICQGRPHQSPAEKSKLFCWHETHVHPYWKIGPLKAEILSLQDKVEVVQYHDIMPGTAVAFLQNGVNRNHSAAEVNFGTVAKGKKYATVTDTRLTTLSWVPLNSSTEATRIGQLIHRVTGLQVFGRGQSDDLQIGTYGPTGHFDVHVDSVSSYDDDLDEARMATLMFYLSDVTEGGGTAFSQAGVHVTPKKGSAIFWPTLLRSGDANERTWHGACPVIFGEKTVATQWILYSGQHHLQCHTDRTKKLEVLVNGKSKYDLH